MPTSPSSSHSLGASSRCDHSDEREEKQLPGRDQRAHASKCASRLPGPQPSGRSLSDPGPPRGAAPASANLTPSSPQLQLSSLSPLLSHDFLPALAGLRSAPRGILRAPAPAAAVPGAHVGVLRAGRGRPSALREAGGGQGARGRRWRGAGEEAGSPGGKGGGDSAWKGRCTRICMKHRLGTGGSGSGAGARCTAQTGPGSEERAVKEEGSGEARLPRRGTLRL